MNCPSFGWTARSRWSQARPAASGWRCHGCSSAGARRSCCSTATRASSTGRWPTSSSEGSGGDHVELVVGDVSVAVDCGRAVAVALERFGRLDILVNNAGIGGTNAPLWEIDDEGWGRVLDVKLNWVFYCCRAAVPTMPAQGTGRIVNIASVAGMEGNPNASHYSVSKAGVIALTKSLGKELATSSMSSLL